MPSSASTEQAPILITMGEPAGIGPEVAIAAFHHFQGRIGSHLLKLVGDAQVFRDIDSQLSPTDLIQTQARARREPARTHPENAHAVIEAIEIAAKACLAAKAAAMVTAPIHKAVLVGQGFGFAGHTEFLAALTGARRAVMMLASDRLRVVPLTIHIPIAKVADTLDKQSLFDAGEIILMSLKRDFGILNPRLAVSGLNPHAGEEGVLGVEEERIIAPAVDALAARGYSVRGPLSADTMFHEEARKSYDAALCMYHDQALIPIKSLSFWDAVNVTLGLPIVRTSPDHGTAFDIAGSGRADARSMIAAVKLAADMADARAR